MIKKINYLAVLLAFSFVFVSCDEEETAEDITIDFEIQMDSEQAPTEISIQNNTTGATEFLWTFEGGEPSSSTEENPSGIKYEDFGTFNVELEAKNELNSEVLSKSFEIKRSTEIVEFTDITLHAQVHADDSPYLFSTYTGESYLYSEIADDEETGELIDITYIGRSGGLTFFASPDQESSHSDRPIPNATTSKFINYMIGSDIDITAEDYDAMTDDSILQDVVIENDSRVFDTDELPAVVLFQNAEGLKGIIKVTEWDRTTFGFVTFDLKIQKYAQ